MKHLQLIFAAVLFTALFFFGSETPLQAQASCPDPISIDLHEVDENWVEIIYENHPAALYTVLRLEINSISVHQVNLSDLMGTITVSLSTPLEDQDFLSVISYSVCKKNDNVTTSDELKSSAFWGTGVATIEEVYISNPAKIYCRRGAEPCEYLEIPEDLNLGTPGGDFKRSEFCSCLFDASVAPALALVSDVMLSVGACDMSRYFLEDKEYSCTPGASLKTEGEENLIQKIEVSPNPCENNLQLNYSSESEEIMDVAVYDIAGNRLHLSTTTAKMNNTNWLYNFDMSELTSGVYIIAIETAEQRYTKKVIKK